MKIFLSPKTPLTLSLQVEGSAWAEDDFIPNPALITRGSDLKYDMFPRRKMSPSKDLIDMRTSLAPDTGGVK